MAAVKKRNWTFVLYPESAPEDWREQLQKTGLLCAISPLHNRDTNPDGEVKKAHYHIILCYSGPTSYDVVKRLTDSLSQPIPQPLEQVRGMYRYFTHQDNPEKAQYDEHDIDTINGFNIRDFVELTGSEIDVIKRSIQQLIIDRNILEYSELMDFLLKTDNFDYYSVAASNTLFFNTYLTSKRNSFRLSSISVDDALKKFALQLVAHEKGGVIDVVDLESLVNDFIGGRNK